MRGIRFALTTVIAVAGLVFLADQRATAKEGISLEDLAGHYSSTCQGTFSICLNSMGPVDCVTGSPTKVVPLTDLDVGALTRDDQGNGCSTFLGVDADLPVDKTPPLVSKVHPAVSKTLNYDPETETGDISVTEYRGGQCMGSTFDGTEAATGAFTFHFAVSNGGKRIDMVTTSAVAFVKDSTGNFIGDFSLSCVNLRQ
jgi:hypothetical protein